MMVVTKISSGAASKLFLCSIFGFSFYNIMCRFLLAGYIIVKKEQFCRFSSFKYF